MGDRTRRKALEGDGEVPQRVRAYLPKKHQRIIA
jgi:cation transport regulator ChaB